MPPILTSEDEPRVPNYSTLSFQQEDTTPFFRGVVNRFTKEFIDRFCDDTGAIDWVKLVGFNSGNYDLDKFLS